MVPRARQARPGHNTSTGFVLTDLDFNLIYANSTALGILCYPRKHTEIVDTAPFIQQQIRSMLRAERFSNDVVPAPFFSGLRRYICRPFRLDSDERGAKVALVLDRRRSDGIEAEEVAQRFRLSPREAETIRYLSRGLTTKEIAHEMSVSPNTIKQFMRLIMSKMGVTTRLGILCKIVSDVLEVDTGV